MKILLFFLLCFTNPLFAANIIYNAVDLQDTKPGEDLWQYNYTVKNHSFVINNGFSIFFDPTSYRNLQSPAPTVNSDWDILVFQPDNSLPDNGIYDALALVDNASLLDKFTINFIWSGTGKPEAQAFEIHDDAFNVIASGNTVSTVPLPAAFPLFSSGLLLLFGSKRKLINNYFKNLSF